MNVDWSNERYVRLYTRDTPDWLSLGWEAQALFVLILRKVDRAGVLELGKSGTRGLAAMLLMPHEVVARCLPALLDDGCVIQRASLLVLPNFLEAQEARQTDRQRQRSAREKRRAGAMSNVTNRDNEPESVTPRDSGVTNRDSVTGACHSTPLGWSHTGGGSVTPAELSRAVPSQPCLAEPDPQSPQPEPPAPPSAGGSALQGGGNDSGAAEAPRRPDGQPSGHPAVPVDERPVIGQPEAEPEDDRPLTKAERIERAHERYAEAYAAGVTSVTGNPLATSKAERADLAALLPVHAKGLRGDALDRWVRETAAAYVQAVRHDDPKYHAGYSPRSFGKWLNGGRPVSKAPFDGKASGTRHRRPEDIKQGAWSMSDAERARVAEQDRARPSNDDDLEAFLADLPADEAEAMRKALKVAS